MKTTAANQTSYSNDLTRLAQDNPSGLRLAISIMRLIQKHSVRFPEDDDFLGGYGDFLVWPENALLALRNIYLKAGEDGDDDGRRYRWARNRWARNNVNAKAIGEMPIGKFYEYVLSSMADREESEVLSWLAEAFKNEPLWPKVVRATLQELPRHASRLRDPAMRNVQLLARLMDLSPAEKSILQHVADLSRYPVTESMELGVKPRSVREALRMLGVMLDETEGAVAKALFSPSSRLLEFGVIEIDRRPFKVYELVKLSDFYRELVTQDYDSEEELVRKVVRPAAGANLEVRDFPHLADDATAAIALLRGAKRERAPGVNLLFYGSPGTGKTEFARRIAADAGLELYEVACEDNDGDAVGTGGRLASLRLALRILSKRPKCAILFDEVEDVFPSRAFNLFGFSMETGEGRMDRISKAWINRLLETNPVPVIWACNQLSGFDPAYTRRYSYHMKFPVPPKSVRRRILGGCTAGLPLSRSLLDRISGDPTLSPGQVRTAADAVKLIAPRDDVRADALFERILGHSQRALDRRLKLNRTESATGYDLSLLNVECHYPLEQMLTALGRRSHATLCFYGAPGTGKTALAQHIAERLDRPLIVRQVSELLSMWVGGTEQNLAAMFEEARAENAVLFLDEADSFLRSRAGATHSWEVTQVNELLQRMESFDGTFICATNLMEIVDEAALRRFSFKLRFQPLSPEQRIAVYAREALGRDGASLLPDHAAVLRRMDGLTLGDVAAVRRQEQVFGERYSHGQFLVQLEMELRSRQKAVGRPIGFIQ